MSLTIQRQTNWFVPLFTLLSWAGMAVHNAFELPNVPLSDPQYLYPSLVSLLLLLGWWLHVPGRKVWRWLLIIWAALHLVGGGLITVLPLPFLPFEPEQSLQHYLVHLFYGAAQLPLLWLLWRVAR